MRGLSASYASGEEAAAWNASSPAATLVTADALLRPAGAAHSRVRATGWLRQPVPATPRTRPPPRLSRVGRARGCDRKAPSWREDSLPTPTRLHRFNAARGARSSALAAGGAATEAGHPAHCVPSCGAVPSIPAFALVHRMKNA